MNSSSTWTLKILLNPFCMIDCFQDIQEGGSTNEEER